MNLLGWVIVIGVALAVVAGFVGWATSTWRTQREFSILQLMPDSRIVVNDSGAFIKVCVKNHGTVPTLIYKIEIVGKEELNVSITVEPGQMVEKVFRLRGEYFKGSTYIVNLYTDQGTLLTYRYTIPAV